MGGEVIVWGSKQRDLETGVDADIMWTYGSKLTFDNKKGQFVGEGADAANPLMTREYRKGFEVKDEV